MYGLCVLGDLLEGTGWVKALIQAKVASVATANSFLNHAMSHEQDMLMKLLQAACTSY